MATGFVYSPRFLDHDTGRDHPERPDRLRAIVDRLKTHHIWDDLTHIPFGPAPLEWVERLHDRTYIERVKQACEAGERFIDTADSAISPASYEVALLAAGGAIAAADAVASGRVHNAFCASRPPGHHAERDRSMGFCLFNNVAIAAEYLIRHHGLSRITIVDFDVHHGNGTQHLFENRCDVLYVSLHEHPMHQYPGTGFTHERGVAGGEACTLNIPLDPGSGDGEYRRAVLDLVTPAIEKHRPDALLLSAGFDAVDGDPLGHMRVSPHGFQWMTRHLKRLAESLCGGRVVSILEGGYDLRLLAECVSLHLTALMQDEGHDEIMAMKAGV
ncbi:MAG: histone deacetylase [Planctomycetes bacterium]|nr:histone deacetylase [Planctomycetota bacterium]